MILIKTFVILLCILNVIKSDSEQQHYRSLLSELNNIEFDAHGNVKEISSSSSNSGGRHLCGAHEDHHKTDYTQQYINYDNHPSQSSESDRRELLDSSRAQPIRIGVYYYDSNPLLKDTGFHFTAKLTSMVAALNLVDKSSDSKFVIYCDSKSVIEAIKKFNSFHPLVQKVQEWLFLISRRHKSVSFCWVPSHVGIQGNEQAERRRMPLQVLM